MESLSLRLTPRAKKPNASSKARTTSPKKLSSSSFIDRMRSALFLFLACVTAVAARAQTFILPTPNRALIADGALGEKYLVGTTGKPWQSGGFGCVRSEGLK